MVKSWVEQAQMEDPIFYYFGGLFFVFIFACFINFVTGFILYVLKKDIGKLGNYSFHFMLLVFFVVWNLDWFVFDHFLKNYKFR